MRGGHYFVGKLAGICQYTAEECYFIWFQARRIPFQRLLKAILKKTAGYRPS